MTTRRNFLRTSSLAAVAAAGRSSRLDPLDLLRVTRRGAPLVENYKATDPLFKELAMRALDAAKSGGASYADIRFTVTRIRSYQGTQPPNDSEAIAMGVRALGQGAWGFAAHTELTMDVAARLGKKAADQAQVMAWPEVPPIEFIDRPPAAVGHWEMPVKRDPFKVPTDEVEALIHSIGAEVVAQDPEGGLLIFLNFQRQERIFASTDGAYTTQTVYTSLGGVPHTNVNPSTLVVLANNDSVNKSGQYKVPFFTPTGAGYEILEDAKIVGHIPEWMEKARELATAQEFQKLGEYDVVFDAYAMASIVDGTFGAALEYDRAVGYEANAGGTSYLAPPLKVLGAACVPATVTITADRSMPGGAATVQWDDEGVVPRAVPLVKNGGVVDYATSREFVSELAPWYKKSAGVAASNGSAASESALTVPLVCTPNLILHPSAQNTSINDLVAGIKDGIMVSGGDAQMDFQKTSGRGRGAQMYLIKQGKVAGPVTNALYTFRSQDLWKNLVALGGAQTASTCGIASFKGEPDQVTAHSVRAVAAHFKKVRVGNASVI